MNTDFIRPFFEGKKKGIQLLFLLLFMVAGTIFFSIIGGGLAYLVSGGGGSSVLVQSPLAIWISQSFSSVGMFLLPALLFSYCQDKHLLQYNKANRKPYYLLVNVTLLLSIVLLPLVAALSQWNEGIRLPEALSGLQRWMDTTAAQAEHVMKVLTSRHTYGTLAVNLLVLAALPALCEEFLFRGTVQVFLSDWLKRPHLAVWVTAVLFSLAHLQFDGFIPRLLLGAYLGYLLLWSRSLWLPVLAHFLHNALTIIADFTLQGRGIFMDEIRFTDIKGSAMLIVTCSLITVLSLLFMWKTQKDL